VTINIFKNNLFITKIIIKFIIFYIFNINLNYIFNKFNNKSRLKNKIL